MSRSWWMKFAFLILSIGFALAYVYPTFQNLDPVTSKFPLKQKMTLGLDLQGGLYMVLGVDLKKVHRDVLDRQLNSLRMKLQNQNVTITKKQEVTLEIQNASNQDMDEDPAVEISFEPQQRNSIFAVIKKEFPHLRLAGEKPGILELALTHGYRDEVREKTLSQSIEVIRNRIDEFGVAEPSITSQGNSRVVVELPGMKEVDRAKELIGKTAKLEFKLVDSQSMPLEKLKSWIGELEVKNHFTEKDAKNFSEYVKKLNEFARAETPRILPETDDLSFERIKTEEGETLKSPLLVERNSVVTGEDLEDASVQFDAETRNPTVGFKLNPHGAKIFEDFTGSHIHSRLAIVLDSVVYSAPFISSKIGASGQITLGRGDPDSLLKEAKDLAIVLRAGALPAQLEFLEQRVVGPSLGKDSIHKGAMASLVGSLAVFVFVILYYRISGLIAVFSLILNVLFVIVLLIALEATLTLPGIAAIALTVGIAVDSNVVIYERIREELRLKNPFRIAVDLGFQKAFRTILDANITNAAAALVLLFYGTGPIKGFAVTLMIGIVTTLFTAVFVCRLIFDAYLYQLEKRKLSKFSI